MKTIVSYKVESSGFPVNGQPSEGDNQPHIVRLSAIKYGYTTNDVRDTFDVIIFPDGWVIPNETIAFHGITQTNANGNGIPESEAIKKFLEFCEGSTLITSSKYFNKRMIRIASKRFCDISVSDKWNANDDHICVLTQAKKEWSVKKLTLAEAAKTLELEYSKCDSMLDAQTTARIYFAINQ